MKSVNYFCISVVQSIKLTLVVKTTNLEYSKLPLISPGLIQCKFVRSFGWAYKRGAYIRMGL